MQKCPDVVCMLHMNNEANWYFNNGKYFPLHTVSINIIPLCCHISQIENHYNKATIKLSHSI